MKRPPLWTTFTDTVGNTLSFSRVASGALLASTIVWGSYIVYRKDAIPDFTSVALLFGAIYGLNRAGEVTSSWLEKKNGTTTNGDKK